MTITSIQTPVSGGYRLPAGTVVQKFDPSGWTKMPDEEIARFKEEQDRMKAETAKANDPALIAAHKAVKVHTVIRVGGTIVAAVYRDGQTAFFDNKADIGRDAFERFDGLPDAQRRNAIVDAIMKKLGPGAVEQRYGETGWAPTRGVVDKEANDAIVAQRIRLGLEVRD